MPTVNVYLPDDLYREYRKIHDSVNMSKLFQEFFRTWLKEQEAKRGGRDWLIIRPKFDQK